MEEVGTLETSFAKPMDPPSGFWDFGDGKEAAMHSIHAYPAKFPAFIASKAFEYAEMNGVTVNRVADVFCGCGTVALEAKLHGKEFWGCDINPVAALIARAKSQSYSSDELKRLFAGVTIAFSAPSRASDEDLYSKANERLRYWFDEGSYCSLLRLKSAIDKTMKDGKYKDAFYCVFSSILKKCSRWLSSSIKPQLDKEKEACSPFAEFSRQFGRFLSAVDEVNGICGGKGISQSSARIRIKCSNFLAQRRPPKVDMIITSPPYVTSYEYADIHQLSSLWLGFASDYKTLRKGSIGSSYGESGSVEAELSDLNPVGAGIVKKLKEAGEENQKTASVARYYLDIQKAVANCYKMLNPGGIAIFVVGDTEYKGVKILNSAHLMESMRQIGFGGGVISQKRIISGKILTPFRNADGKFSHSASDLSIYHEESVIIGRKK